MKGKTIAQWMNLLRNSRFVNRTIIYGLCEKTGTLGLVLPGLTAGRQAGRQADEIILSLEIFKIL